MTRTARMRFNKTGDWKVSECGNYRIQPIGWELGRTSTFRLSILLADGWVDYPEAFKLFRKARAEAERIEDE